MEGVLTISIGIGLVTSLAFSEMLGLAAGGMVVPGYMAVYMDKPLVVLLTLGVSYLTWFSVHAMGTVTIIYGRRRTVLMILVGFAFGWIVRAMGGIELPTGTLDLSVVGYIIPGLIAIWIDRQGLMETIAAMLTASVIVRLALILVLGGEIVP